MNILTEEETFARLRQTPFYELADILQELAPDHRLNFLFGTLPESAELDAAIVEHGWQPDEFRQRLRLDRHNALKEYTQRYHKLHGSGPID